MKNCIKFICLLALIIAGQVAKAQDKILLRGRVDTLVVKVLEVGVNEIKYKLWPVDENMPVMAEKKDRIRRVIFENGTVMRFSEDEFVNEANYASQKKMACKVDFYAFVRGVFSSSFEYSLKPGISLEGGLGVVGIGNPNPDIYDFDKARGGFVRMGLKFINTPNYYMSGMRYSHILKGGYIRPEVVLLSNTNTRTFTGQFFNSQTGSYSNYFETTTHKVTGSALFTNFGKQWVFSDAFCIDFFIGLGVGKKKVTSTRTGNTGLGTTNYSNNYSEIDETGGYGFITFTEANNTVAFSTQVGLKMGILIGGNGSKKK